MRKLKLGIQMTADGFADGLNGENDWVFISGPDAAGLQNVTELAESCDTLLLGRKMAPVFMNHWENTADNQPDSPQHRLAEVLVDIRKIVFSHTETSISGRNAEIENGDLATVVRALKNTPGKDILVYGGIDFVSSLISLNLIDEYYIYVCPVVIGVGRSIFKERKILKLESSTAFNNGKVLNKYLPA